MIKFLKGLPIFMLCAPLIISSLIVFVAGFLLLTIGNCLAALAKLIIES